VQPFISRGEGKKLIINNNMKLSDVIFVDTETTSSKDARLLQLGTMKYGETVPKVNSYKPAVPIEIEAMVVHGITNEEAALFPEINFSEETKKELLPLILVAHKADFDIEVLKKEGIQTGLFIDTLKVAQTIIDSPSHGNQYLRYFLNLEVSKGAKPHDAGGDVLVLEALFKYLFVKVKELMEEENCGLIEVKEEDILNRMIKISSEPVLLKKVPFGKYKGMSFEEALEKDASYLRWMIQQKDLSDDLKYTLNKYLS